MGEVQGGGRPGGVHALMRTAAFLARQSRTGDLAGQWERVRVGEPLQVLEVAAQAGAFPQGGARRTRRHRVGPAVRWGAGTSWDVPVERGERGAAPEHEA